ncbi:MAG: hypothetical protein A2X02_01755 [Bacteroidetes bacterium GWF2_29_10]|nr:MAG: hypothetical protein A2X02_01755 [Bacteroidetes bacterium GWF2_29_10]
MGFEDLKDKKEVLDNNSKLEEESNNNVFIKLKKLLLKDSMVLGIVMGLLLPIISFFLLSYINLLFKPSRTYDLYYLQDSTIYALSIVMNILTFRYYMINKKLDKVGKGILAVTFMYVIIFFIFQNLI